MRRARASGLPGETAETPDLAHVPARDTDQVDTIISQSDKCCQKEGSIRIKRGRLVRRGLSELVLGWYLKHEEAAIGGSEGRTVRAKGIASAKFSVQEGT